jgi:hypothetical protein
MEKYYIKIGKTIALVSKGTYKRRMWSLNKHNL